MAGIRLNIAAADIWFGSVQKMFWAPGGACVMVLSPKAMESIYRINERAHYNSLAFYGRHDDQCKPLLLRTYSAYIY